MLDPSADEIRDWGNSVIEFMADYHASLRDGKVYRRTSSGEIRDRLDPVLPTKQTDFEGLLNVFRETIIPFTRQNAHPRMFGYVQSPGTALAAFADLLASTLNANLTVWRSAPAPVELERLTIDWIRQILGFNPEAGGLFVSGGSMANLTAIAAARHGKDDLSGRLRIYASGETHFSIAKAAALLGIGRENVRHVAVDKHFKIRTDDLVAKINADVEAGYVPFCVVANAGTVNTGAVDPLAEIREV
ncbi:MAG TPA: pyridoxal-dependent decarboxylase, partial [Candidatus Acidoferrum sp.]|nr:pyridoxal-dependent decarboxylase [Candidatus Acidoferrum sp.]